MSQFCQIYSCHPRIISHSAPFIRKRVLAWTMDYVPSDRGVIGYGDASEAIWPLIIRWTRGPDSFSFLECSLPQLGSFQPHVTKQLSTPPSANSWGDMLQGQPRHHPICHTRSKQHTQNRAIILSKTRATGNLRMKLTNLPGLSHALFCHYIPNINAKCENQAEDYGNGSLSDAGLELTYWRHDYGAATITLPICK